MQPIIVVGMFVLVFMVVYLASSAIKDARQTSVRRALLEKFASAPDLGAFLQTNGGQRFMDELSSGAGNPLQSVLSSIQKGILLMFIGAGFFPLSMGFKENSPVVSGIGIVLILAGSGFLVSAAVTYLLSRWWGMLSSATPTDDKNRSSVPQ